MVVNHARLGCQRQRLEVGIVCDCRFAPIRSVASPVVSPVCCARVEAGRPHNLVWAKSACHTKIKWWSRRELNSRPNELNLSSYLPLLLTTSPVYRTDHAVYGLSP